MKKKTRKENPFKKIYEGLTITEKKMIKAHEKSEKRKPKETEIYEKPKYIEQENGKNTVKAKIIVKEEIVEPKRYESDPYVKKTIKIKAIQTKTKKVKHVPVNKIPKEIEVHVKKEKRPARKKELTTEQIEKISNAQQRALTKEAKRKILDLNQAKKTKERKEEKYIRILMLQDMNKQIKAARVKAPEKNKNQLATPTTEGEVMIQPNRKMIRMQIQGRPNGRKNRAKDRILEIVPGGKYILQDVYDSKKQKNKNRYIKNETNKPKIVVLNKTA